MRYGALYFKDHAPEGCVTAEVVSDVPESVKDDVKARFVIGPLVNEAFWQDERAHMRIERGPCKQSKVYVQTHMLTDIRREHHRAIP